MCSKYSRAFTSVRCWYGNCKLFVHQQMPCKVPIPTRNVQTVSSMLSKRRVPPIAYALLVIPGSAFCLGSWQVQRLQWKRNLIRELENKMRQPAVELPNELSEVSKLEYRKVFIKGTFDHSKEMLYGPRPVLIEGRYTETGGLISAGGSGFCVVTPFKLTDTGETILVNRGWVAKKKKHPKTRVEGQVEDEQELIGVVRLQEKRSPFMPQSFERSTMFLYRDLDTMSAISGSLPVFVDACDGVKGGPFPGQTRVTIRNEHLSYLLTWYSLSFITSFMWYRRYINARAFI